MSRTAVVERLLRAREGGGLVAPATADLPDLDERAAYAIQREVADHAGSRLVGWKVGMASAIDRGPGTPGPIYGRLLADMQVQDGGTIPRDVLHAPEVEGEIAFVLGAPLRGPGVTVADVLAATCGVLPAIEIFAGRLEPGDHPVPDLIADNAFSARFVVGEHDARVAGRDDRAAGRDDRAARLVPLDGLDLRLVGMVQARGDEIVGAGAGARVLGHPAASVAWLANALAANDEPAGLEPGQIVLSGSLAPPVPAQPGDTFTVELDRLGSLTVGFGS